MLTKPTGLSTGDPWTMDGLMLSPRAHELQTYCLPHPIGLYNVDRSPDKIGKITELINCVVWYKGHKSWSKFYVLSIRHKVIVLGHTWLVEHNPNIDWHTGEVKFTHCPDYCRQAESTSNHPDNDVLVEPVETMIDTSERIHGMSMVSMQLAEAAKGDTTHATLEEMIPEMYHCF